jgi:hypothetical protein
MEEEESRSASLAAHQGQGSAEQDQAIDRRVKGAIADRISGYQHTMRLPTRLHGLTILASQAFSAASSASLSAGAAMMVAGRWPLAGAAWRTCRGQGRYHHRRHH